MNLKKKPRVVKKISKIPSLFRIIQYNGHNKRACHALAGKDKANPTGPLLCAALMLRHLKLDKQADQVECAIRTVYKDSDIRTEDVGGKAKCSEFVKAVCGCLDKAK